VDLRDLTVNFFDLRSIHANLVPTMWIAEGWLLEPLLEQVLSHYLVKGASMAINDLKSTLVDVTSGLEFLHRSGYVHGDIKPHNIGLAAGKAALCDFGTATQHRRARPFAGSLRTRPPELHVDSAAPTEASDVWRIVATWMALVAPGIYPFVSETEIAASRGNSSRLVSSRLRGGESTLQRRISSAIPNRGLSDLFCDCLRYDPAKRPSLSDFTTMFQSGTSIVPRTPTEFSYGGKQVPGLRAISVIDDPALTLVQVSKARVLVATHSCELFEVDGNGTAHDVAAFPETTNQMCSCQLPDGCAAFGTGSGKVFLYSPQAGLTEIAALGETVQGVSFSRPTGVLFAVTESHLYRVASGGGTSVFAGVTPMWSVSAASRSPTICIGIAKRGLGGVQWVSVRHAARATRTLHVHAKGSHGDPVEAHALAKHPIRDEWAIGNTWGGATLVSPRTKRSQLRGPSFRLASHLVRGTSNSIQGEGDFGDDDPCTSLTYSPDGLFLAAGHVSGRIVVWELSLGQETSWVSLTMYPGNADGTGVGHVHAMAFIDGTRLVAACASGTYIVSE
jgi:hypothetical protein